MVKIDIIYFNNFKKFVNFKKIVNNYNNSEFLSVIKLTRPFNKYTKFYILIQKGKIMNDSKVIATVFVLITLAISIQLLL